MRTSGRLAPQLGERGDHSALARQRPAADRHPFVHQRGLGDPPAFADVAQAQAVRDPHVSEEDLVELGLTGELAQWPHLDAGCLHVAEEVRHAAVLGHVRVGPGHQDRPGRLVGQRGPHLLAVDDPGVTVADRTGAHVGEVGSRAGFGEELAPDLLASPQWTKETPLLLVGTVPQDGRCGHTQPDADQAWVVVRRTGRHERLVDAGLQRPRPARPPRPTGKWTQARPASNRARRNSSRSVPAGGCAARNSRTRPSITAASSSVTWTAGNVDDLTRHEAGALADQERHRVGDVLGLADPAHRDLLLPRLL